MTALLRNLASFVLRYSGLPLFVRNVLARRKATIIVYHDPRPDAFDAHLRYLTRRYRIIPLDQLVDAIRRRDWSDIPLKSLVITFDDGHRGNYELLPVIQKYGIRPTIYLVSGVVASRRHYWFRQKVALIDYLKHKPNKRRLALLAERSRFTQTREYPGNCHALTADEIEEMAPWVDFQSHTCFHPILPGCTDEECRMEIEDSKRDLEMRLGCSVEHFSYPNGDYTDREVALLRDAGYASARTVDVGWNDVHADPYRLKVTGVADDASINTLASQLTGLTMYLRYRLMGSPGGRWPITPIEQNTHEQVHA